MDGFVSVSFSNFRELLLVTFKRAGIRWMTTLDLPVALLKAFELGPALFQGPEEAILTQLLSHSPIHLAVPMAVSESFIKFSLTENCKECSSLSVAPVHAHHLLIIKAPVILFHPAASLSLGW
uniref:Uncharacterized protein n=1 Tax=Peromyscus maniculatus bairdii TaxID=230844 RepID=A0A8C8UEP4_PERMB